MPRENPRREKRSAKKNPLCPECQSNNTVAIVHGLPTPRQQKAIDKGRAMLADREDWEGMTEWYCRACGCDWSRTWRRYKKPPATK